MQDPETSHRSDDARPDPEAPNLTGLGIAKIGSNQPPGRFKAVNWKGGEMKKIKTFLLGVFLLTTPFSGLAGESARNTSIGNEIIKKSIIPVLVAHKLCSGDQSSDAQSCWFHGEHIWMSAKGGIQFFIYGISDRKLINELLVVIIQASNQYPPNLQFSVDVFAHSYSERSVWKRPIVQLLIKGER